MFYNEISPTDHKDIRQKKRIVLATTKQLSIAAGVIHIVTPRSSHYIRMPVDQDGRPLVLKVAGLPVPPTIDAWFESFRDGAAIPVQTGTMVACHLQSIGGLPQACQVQLRCTTKNFTDTVSPVSVHGDKHGHWGSTVLVGPTAAEACCIRVDLHKSGKPRSANLIAFACIPLAKITEDGTTLESHVAYGVPKVRTHAFCFLVGIETFVELTHQ